MNDLSKAAMTAIRQSTMELAGLMNSHPEGLEKPVLQAGENLVGVFSDDNYSIRRFANLHKMKIQVLLDAVEDIAGGVLILRTSVIGLSFTNNKLVSYISPLGEPPKGSVVFSVNWKDIASFRQWRQGEESEVTQEAINNANYFLSFQLAKYL